MFSGALIRARPGCTWVASGGRVAYAVFPHSPPSLRCGVQHWALSTFSCCGMRTCTCSPMATGRWPRSSRPPRAPPSVRDPHALATWQPRLRIGGSVRRGERWARRRARRGGSARIPAPGDQPIRCRQRLGLTPPCALYMWSYGRATTQRQRDGPTHTRRWVAGPTAGGDAGRPHEPGRAARRHCRGADGRSGSEGEGARCV
jgi:hypothetical protein